MIGPATAAVPASYRGYRTPEMEHREHQPKVAAGRSATWQETGSTYPYKSVHPRRTVTYTTRLALPRHGSASGLATLKPRLDPRNKNAELARRYGTLACADTRALSALCQAEQNTVAEIAEKLAAAPTPTSPTQVP